jgi:chromosome segregation ATPase
MSDLKRRLNEAVERRDRAARNAERVQGRLDSARKSVETVEAEIRSKGVEPNKLDSTIEAVEQKLSELVSDLERRIDESERAIAPFLGEEIL